MSNEQSTIAALTEAAVSKSEANQCALRAAQALAKKREEEEQAATERFLGLG